ncbi:MAG: sulfatase-like hydrolase/transferase [Phycisphaerae bacterium]
MQRPNILIVMTDHQRADTAGPDHPSVTPHLDGLAREGVRFTETFCPSPHCCPSRATFFTGLYPSRHGVWNNICNGQAHSRGLTEGVRCFSQDLAEAGYRLEFSGKWHVSVEAGPGDYGFNERFASAGKGARHGLVWDDFARLAETKPPRKRQQGHVLRPGWPEARIYGYDGWDRHTHDERAVAEGIDAIGDCAAGDDPWCVYIGMTGPHDPYDVPAQYLDLYDLDDVPLPPSYGDEMADKPGIYRRMRKQIFGQLSEKEVRDAIRHFWAYCSYLDDKLGQILRALDKTAQAENTLVLYCSDHGDYCGEHGLFAKGIPCFRGAYHIPAVVRWPAGVVKPGRCVDQLVSLADFAPTFQDLAGARVDPSLTGRSLADFLADKTPPDWRQAIHTQCDGVELYYTQRSVATREWKFVYNGFDFDELYDLTHDPHELHNLAEREEFQPVIEDLCGRMWRFARDEHDTAINPYITVGLAPFGPATAFQSGPTDPL